MGFIELEQFVVAGNVTDAAFAALDDRVQAWSHAHRAGLRRRTTAFGPGRRVLVVTLFAGLAPPEALGLDDAGGPRRHTSIEALHAAIEPGTYSRAVFEDRG